MPFIVQYEGPAGVAYAKPDGISWDLKDAERFDSKKAANQVAKEMGGGWAVKPVKA